MSSRSPESDRWFAEEVFVHKAALRSWLLKTFPAISDPEGIAQEAMVRAWRANESSRVESPRAFLFATARNLALDELRRSQLAGAQMATASMDEVMVDAGANPAEATAHRQELELLTEAIQSLPEQCRRVLTLRKVYGLTQKQIAQRLGIAEHTVEAQVGNGMRRCARFFSRLGLP